MQIANASWNDLCHLFLQFRLRDHNFWRVPTVTQLETEYGIIVLGPESGITAQIRRGFISEIRCTLADWVGGVCDACDGIGTIYSLSKCFCCKDGRTPAHGPAIAAAGALERVTLTNKRAWDATGLAGDMIGNRQVWRWMLKRPDHENSTDELPFEIYTLMIHLADRESLSYLEFSSEQAANDALSQALIVWAEAQIP